jgi:hypothetical protein
VLGVGRRWSQPARIGAAALALAGALGGCGSDDGEGPADGPTPPSGPDLTHADLWLSFDDPASAAGPLSFPDAAGGPSLGQVVSGFDGAVDEVAGPDGRGSAISFPVTCTEPTGCPRAMVEVAHAAALDPTDHDFTYGATVWLAPDETATGSNLVQKGRFGTEGGQWKLQVDGAGGEPSCVVRGDDPGAEPLVVHSEVSVSDSQWHAVVCHRDEGGISIEVDGEVEHEDGRTGSVTNEWPIRIGAPGVNEGDDQFHGRIDDVFLLIDVTS